MISKILSNSRLLLTLIIILIIINIPFQLKIDKERNKFKSIEESLNVNSSTLKKISLGFNELLADIYWFRALQYFGTDEINTKDKDTELMYGYLDVITDLDPKFVNAYRFGGTFLAEPIPQGLGDFENGVKILEKGRENNPENFRIPLDEAFLYYLHTDDYKKAAELFEESSNKPGLSEFRKSSIKGMAATAGFRSGNRELSKQIWQEIYDNANIEGRKNFALKNLNELYTQDFEDKLTKIALQYEIDKGSFPDNLLELKNNGYLKKIPKDHEGEQFVAAKNIKKIKSRSLLKKTLDENIGFYTAKAHRYKSIYGNYPADIEELKIFFIETSVVVKYSEHPLGEEYIYDPETGKVDYDKWFLE